MKELMVKELPVKAKNIVVDGSKKGRPKKRCRQVIEKKTCWLEG